MCLYWYLLTSFLPYIVIFMALDLMSAFSIIFWTFECHNMRLFILFHFLFSCGGYRVGQWMHMLRFPLDFHTQKQSIAHWLFEDRYSCKFTSPSALLTLYQRKWGAYLQLLIEYRSRYKLSFMLGLPQQFSLFCCYWIELHLTPELN